MITHKMLNNKGGKVLTMEERSSLARRIVDFDLFYEYPTWFDEIPLGEGSLSEENPIQAWKILALDNEERQRYIPISQVVDNKIEEKEMFVAVVHDIVEKDGSFMVNQDVVEVVKDEILIDAISYNLIKQDYDMLYEQGCEEQVVNESLVGFLKEVDNNFMERKEPEIRDEMIRNVKIQSLKVQDIGKVQVKEQKYGQVQNYEEFRDVCVKDKLNLMTNQGIRRMTNNFIYGRLSLDMIYMISDFLDIRQVMLDYSLRVVYVLGFSLKKRLIDMLVRNGFFVIDPRYRYQPILDNKMLLQGMYGVYSDMNGNIPYAVYRNSRNFKENNACELDKIIDLEMRSAHCVFTKTYICEDMKWGELGVLPSSFSDQGLVVCVYPPLVSYDKVVLMNRSVDFMNRRYQYMNDGVVWSKLDPMGWKCGYSLSFIIPWNTKKFYLMYSRYRGLKDFTHKIKENPFDSSFMIELVKRKILREDDREAIVLRMIKAWGTDDMFSWVRLWYLKGVQLDEFLERLAFMDMEMSRLIRFCRTFMDVKRLIGQRGLETKKNRRLMKTYNNKFKKVLL